MVSSSAIGKNTIGYIHYTIKDFLGNVLYKTSEKQPVEFIYGLSTISPGIEKALKGMKAGEKKEIVLNPSEGYGTRDKSLIIKVKRSELPEGNLNVGDKIRKIFSNGNSELFTVTGFIDDWIFIDGNHPLAGKTLYVNIEIINIHDIPET